MEKFKSENTVFLAFTSLTSINYFTDLIETEFSEPIRVMIRRKSTNHEDLDTLTLSLHYFVDTVVCDHADEMKK